jgi:hypothetical protein
LRPSVDIPSDADDGDAHEIHTEVDNWDLRDHHREGTRVQNRRNVQVGSCDNQQKPHPGKDGFLVHTRLGLVANQTVWTEDQFTVTSSAGIRNHEKRAADTVVRELKRAKPGAWACIQTREVWSTEFWRLTCGLDTSGCASSGRFLVA